MIKMGSQDAKVGLLEIAEGLAKIENIQRFVDNINHIYPNKEWTLFEWWETYLAWSELATEKDMEIFYD
jgi:hypothetical protein